MKYLIYSGKTKGTYQKMKRPLLIVAISYILGIIMGVYFKKGIPIILLMGVSYLLLILINNKYIENGKIHIYGLRMINKRIGFNNPEIYGKTPKFNETILENRKFNMDNRKTNNHIKAIVLILITIIISYANTIHLNKKYDLFYEEYNRRRDNICGDNMQRYKSYRLHIYCDSKNR